MSKDIQTLLNELPPSFSKLTDRHDLEILGTGKRAIAFKVPAAQLESSWKRAASLVKKTKRWPIAVIGWGEGGIDEQDLFSRNFYREERRSGDISPDAIIKRSTLVDPKSFFERRKASLIKQYPISEEIEYSVEALQDRFRKGPGLEEVSDYVRANKVKSRYDLEAWLLEWERKHKIKRNAAEGRHEWFSHEPTYLVFLPVTNSWEALAYIHWYGCLAYKTEELIAIGKMWQRKFGAELFASYGTMLECFVSKPPATQDAAWRVAIEHDLVSPYTNGSSFTPIRQYALGLKGHGRWFFHERP